MSSKYWLALPALAGLLYVAVLLYAYAVQDASLYFPTLLEPQQAKFLAARGGLRPWPSDAAEPVGYVAEPATSTAQPDRGAETSGAPPVSGRVLGTVLVFHGNAGTALDRGYYVDALGRLGYRVVLAEYPGYGARRGELGERSFVRDATGALDRARSEFGAPVYVVGESLGAGVAAAVARDRGSKVAGVALITPWDSLTAVAQERYPLLPMGLLLTSRYDSVTNLSAYEGPVAVAVADEDEILRPGHALRLYDSLRQPKGLWRFPGAGHNSWPSMPEATWWPELAAFWAAGAREM